MRYIVLLCPDDNTTSKLKNVLSQSGLCVSFNVKSAPDALRLISSSLMGGVIISCGISPFNMGRLIQMLPQSWDILVLLSSGQTPPLQASNSSYMNMPLDRQSFVSAVTSLCVSSSSVFGSKSSYSGQRSKEETETIDRAKKIIMQKKHCSESEAYKLIRTESMNNGVKIYETAEKICREDPERNEAL